MFPIGDLGARVLCVLRRRRIGHGGAMPLQYDKSMNDRASRVLMQAILIGVPMQAALMRFVDIVSISFAHPLELKSSDLTKYKLI
jgi:hypothetical protein